MGYSSGTGSRGTDTFNSTPQTVADLQRLNDGVAARGNRRIGTAANRTALAGADLYDGLSHHDTDTQLTYERINGSWKAAPFKRLYYLEIADADRPNLSAMGSVALASVPFATRASIKLIGVIGFSGTANTELGANITTTAGTLTDTQSNQQVFCESISKWYPYSHIARLDRAASTAATVAFSFSAVGGVNGHFKGQVEITVYGPDEY